MKYIFRFQMWSKVKTPRQTMHHAILREKGYGGRYAGLGMDVDASEREWARQWVWFRSEGVMR